MKFFFFALEFCCNKNQADWGGKLFVEFTQSKKKGALRSEQQKLESLQFAYDSPLYKRMQLGVC